MNPTAAITQVQPARRSVEDLEAEITTLAAHLNAATYRFLALIADFDRREGWGGWGVRSCAHWLSWKCSLGLCAAREKLRVAHALECLPLIADAMQRGTLSYAKVRAMTRIATKDNERFLLTIAENGTATHVETTVRHYRRTHRVEELEQDRARHKARSLRYYWDHDGCLVIEGRLPPEQGAVVVKALEAADEALQQARAREEDDSAESSTGMEVRMRDAEATELETRAAAHDSAESSRTDSVVHNAAPRSGAAHDSAESSPVEAPSWGNRQADAFALIAETLLAHGPTALRGADKHLVHVHIDLGALCTAGGDGKSAIENGPTLPPETVRRLCCDGGLVTWLENGAGSTLDVGRKTRAIPPALRRALDKRDGGCRFPGCENRRFVDAHHIEHWADGGATKIENLALLCRYHHRLVHEGGFGMEREGDGLRFTRPDGREVPAVSKLPRVAWADSGELRRQHEERGLGITASTAIPHWGGERADYNYMLIVLDQCDERRRRGTLADHPREG
jgi:hypothetical protein